MDNKDIRIIFFSLLIFIIFLSSCTPLSKIKYIQKQSKTTTDTISTSKLPYLLQVGDNLYIDLKTSNPEMRTLITGKSESNNIAAASSTPTSLYIISYQIDDNWNIQLPLAGTINCKNMTCDILRDSIQNSLRKYITDALVLVKLVNINITILGEVNRPGQFYANQKQTSLFDAIGMAGDLTLYGNRQNITIMRKLQNGDYKLFYLDITKSEIIKHEAFILMPNDIVYVEPLKTKPFGLASFPYSTLFSTITTLILILTFLKK
jgi:polysaccharide export outer membrane protein